jgi:hypothetical protein
MSALVESEIPGPPPPGPTHAPRQPPPPLRQPMRPASTAERIASSCTGLVAHGGGHLVPRAQPLRSSNPTQQALPAGPL